MLKKEREKNGMILYYPYPTDPRVRSEALTLVAAGHQVSLFCIDIDNQKIEDKQRFFKFLDWFENNADITPELCACWYEEYTAAASTMVLNGMNFVLFGWQDVVWFFPENQHARRLLDDCRG